LRILFDLTAVVSLALLIGTIVIWVRSYSVADTWCRAHGDRFEFASADRGCVLIGYVRGAAGRWRSPHNNFY
jgi:hypothetical protein